MYLYTSIQFRLFTLIPSNIGQQVCVCVCVCVCEFKCLDARQDIALRQIQMVQYKHRDASQQSTFGHFMTTFIHTHRAPHDTAPSTNTRLYTHIYTAIRTNPQTCARTLFYAQNVHTHRHTHIHTLYTEIYAYTPDWLLFFVLPLSSSCWPCRLPSCP